MADLVRFIKYGNNMSSRIRGTITHGSQTITSLFSAVNAKSKELPPKRTAIGFKPQELDKISNKARKSKVKISGFHIDETDKKRVRLNEFINSFIKSIRKHKKSKTRRTAGFVPQELTKHNKDKVRQQIGFLYSPETFNLNKHRLPMSNSKEIRITAGFVQQEVENHHTVKEILKSIWEILKIRIKVAAKMPTTRIGIGYNPQELNNHLGESICSKIGL